MDESRQFTGVTAVGTIVSSLLASACCIGPLVPALLGVGFWLAYRKPKLVEGDACGCQHPQSNRLGRVLLWTAAALALAFWPFPYFSGFIPGMAAEAG